MASIHLNSLTARTEVYADGQKVIAAVLEYHMPVLAKGLSPDCFQVAGRTVTEVTVSEDYHGAPEKQGRFVELTLDSDEMGASTKERVGTGPLARLAVRPVALTVDQIGPVLSVGGETLAAFAGAASTRTDNGIMEHFCVHTFQVPGTGRTLNYNLYIPSNCIYGQKYPLVLFMHDAGSCSDETCAALVQGNGAVVWARDAEMGKRPCYVVAPHYPEICANDNFEVSWQADTTVELIKYLTTQFSIDTTRIYGTGQSMGCMMLCEMLLKYPRFFAGSLLVAGQWDPNRMAAAKDDALWAVVSAEDQKAFPIMGACLEKMEQAGGRLSRQHLDGRMDTALLAEAVYRQKMQECNLNFTWFEGKSVLPHGVPDNPGMHHISTWIKAYDIEVLREWLFEQRMNGEWCNGLY